MTQPTQDPATKPLDEQIDELLKQFGDYGNHDNDGWGDCNTCKKISSTKTAIKALIANTQEESYKKGYIDGSLQNEQ